MHCASKTQKLRSHAHTSAHALRLTGSLNSPSVLAKTSQIPDASGAIVVENMPNVEGFPAVYWYGGHSGHRVLVMDVLGPSLEDVHRLCCRRFSLHTVLLLGLQMLERIEAVHSCGILHRDIKPQNFCLGHGKEKNDTVYLIDMGLSKPFLSPDSNRHIPCISGKKLAGTARYASIATHLGYEQGRRDDVESLAYVLLYLLHGSLPWRGIHASSKRYKYKLIGEKKQATPLPELCGGVPELELYIQYCRNLAFEEQPDYEYLKGVLHSALARTGRCVDAEFDWKKLAEFKSRDGLEGACRSMKPSGMTSDKEAMASPVR